MHCIWTSLSMMTPQGIWSQYRTIPFWSIVVVYTDTWYTSCKIIMHTKRWHFLSNWLVWEFQRCMFVFSLRLFDFQSYKDNNTSQSIPKGQEGCERMAGEKSRAEENLCSFFKCLRLQLSNQQKSLKFKQPTATPKPWLGGGFKDFLCSSLFGEDFHFDQYSWDGLKPPTSWGWSPQMSFNFRNHRGPGPCKDVEWRLQWKSHRTTMSGSIVSFKKNRAVA